MSTSPPIEKHFRAALLLKQHNEPVEHQNFPRTVRWMPIRWVSASQGARWAALFTMCLILPGALAYIGCKDESGNAVDWWYAFKIKFSLHVAILANGSSRGRSKYFVAANFFGIFRYLCDPPRRAIFLSQTTLIHET